MTPTLTPAYGRDYKSFKAAVKDFKNGKDFVYDTPRKRTYCSIRNFRKGDEVKFCYDRQTKAGYYEVKA